MEKIQDGRRQPYLSIDRYQIWPCTTSLLGEHPRQVSKEYEKWPHRRCDKKNVTILNTGEVTISKMATWQSYLLMNQNYFWGDIIV